MHQSETMIKQLYFGFDAETLYLRFDISRNQENEQKEELNLDLLFLEKGIKISVPLSRNSNDRQYTILEKTKDEAWAEVRKDGAAAYDKILEVGIKFKDIKVEGGEVLKLTATVESAEAVIERCPEYGAIEITLPGPDYASRTWSV